MVAWMLIAVMVADTCVSVYLVTRLREQSKRIDLMHEVVMAETKMLKGLLTGGDDGEQ